LYEAFSALIGRRNMAMCANNTFSIMYQKQRGGGEREQPFFDINKSILRQGSRGFRRFLITFRSVPKVVANSLPPTESSMTELDLSLAKALTLSTAMPLSSAIRRTKEPQGI
jgi:hypothetical protein